MFGQAERTICNLNTSVQTINSRLSACENSIDTLNNTMYADSPIWSKIYEIEYNTASLAEKIAFLQEEIKVLSAQLDEHFSTIGAEPDVKSAIPKQKIDLEILEQNDEDQTNYFIVPEYCLYDE